MTSTIYLTYIHLLTMVFNICVRFDFELEISFFSILKLYSICFVAVSPCEPSIVLLWSVCVDTILDIETLCHLSI